MCTEGRSRLEGTESAKFLWVEYDLPSGEMDRSVGEPGHSPTSPLASFLGAVGSVCLSVHLLAVPLYFHSIPLPLWSPCP